jgi:glycerol-3-phosphate dehydrogenase
LAGDPEDYPQRFIEGCGAAGIEVSEIDVATAIAREPLLNPQARRVFEVPDATIEPFRLVAANVQSATEHGAQVWTNAEVVGFRIRAGRILAVDVKDTRDGHRLTVETGGVVSASGAWAGRVARLAGIDLAVAPGWGVMVIVNERLTRSVVNRCRMPSDGDILLPVGTVSIAGTTSRTMESPDGFEISRDEVMSVINASSQMVPALMHARVLRVYAGARPLYDPSQERGASRSLSRAHTVLDHAPAGVDNFVSIVGGKLTTYRLMAEQTADAICRKLGNQAPCRTGDEPLPGAEPGRHYSLGGRLSVNEVQRGGADADLVCECELINLRAVDACIAGTPGIRLDGMLRALRLGMGPCQGAFCSLRAAGALARARLADGEPALQPLKDFLEERFRGNRPILWGDQARQVAVNEIIYREVLNLDHAAT